MGVSESAVSRGICSEATDELPQEIGSVSRPSLEEAPSEPTGGTIKPPPVQRARALWGTIWVGIGFFAGQMLRFGSNLVLTHLLAPEIFGLMALANTLMLGLALFSDIGTGPSIIQNKAGDEEKFLNTAWTVQVLRGLILTLASVLLAWPAAYFYQIPQLVWLFPAIGANAAIAAFNSTSMFTLARHLVRGPIVIANLSSYAGGMVVTILWVYWVRADVWGFVVGNLVTSLLTLVISHLLVRGYRNRFCWDRSSLNEMVHYGKWIFISTFIVFLTDQADRLVLGKLATLTFLGLYQVASQFALMPVMVIQGVLSQIVFPLYSRHHQSSEGIRDQIRRIHPLVAGIAGITGTLLVVMGPTVITCLYGNRYEGAGWIIRIMGLVALTRILQYASNTTLMSMGDSKASAVSQGGKLAAMVVLMPVGYITFGLEGLISAFAATEIVRYAIVAVELHRRGESVLHYDFGILLFGVASGAITFGICQFLPPDLNNWIQLAVGAGMIMLLWSAMYLALWLRRWSWAPGIPGLVNTVQ